MFWTHSLRAGLLGCALLAWAGLSTAQNIQVPVGQQAPQKRTIDRPTAGMLEDQVLRIFGEPISRTSAVGEPPISRWIYADFVVFFEYDHVVHSVLLSDTATAANN